MPLTEAWLDPEIVHMDRSGISSFSALQEDLSEGATARLVYMVFDLPYLGGWDLAAAALEDSKAVLAKLQEKAPPQSARIIRFSDHQVGEGAALQARARGHHLEAA